MQKLVSGALALALLSFSSITTAEFILLESNSFSGEVTDIHVDELWEDVFKGGDIGVGSKFDASFNLYDAGEGDGSMYFLSTYTFYGYSRNYNFEIEADSGAYWSWGKLDIYPDGLLSIYHYNNFNSDGLEQTFHDYGGDYGGFGLDLNDYDKPTINGSGTFGWEGFDVYFSVSPSNPINEPSSLWLIFAGMTALLAARKARYTKNPCSREYAKA